MGLKKRISDAGWHFWGLIFKIDSELRMKITSNPSLDTTGGGWVHTIKTAIAATFQIYDNVTGESIIKIDADTKIVTAHSNYKAVGFDSNKITFTAQIANYTAKANDWVDMTTGATDKITLFPLVPNINDIVKVSKADADIGIAIQDGNGKLINGNPTDLISNQYTVISYQYNGTEWRKF